MIGPELLAVFYGLSSAASWGAGDFSGGLATKQSHVYSVVIGSQLAGAISLAVMAWFFGEPFPRWMDLFYGCLGGICGVIGLVALYRGLATGQMGVVAPLSAVIAALTPVIIGGLLEGLPTLRQLTAFGLAALAVWLLTGSHSHGRLHGRDIGLPLVAGLGFGLFFIFIDRVSVGAVFWPLVAARGASIGLLFLASQALGGQAQLPTLSRWPLIALGGLFDAGGNAFFALAAQLGRLDISAVLGSLYPATTVLLAWLILRERLLPPQWAGVGAVLVAVVLIAV